MSEPSGTGRGGLADEGGAGGGAGAAGAAGAGAGASRAATSSSAALNAMGRMAGSPFVALRQISLSASSGSPEPWKNSTASGPEMAPEPSVASGGESRGGLPRERRSESDAAETPRERSH